MDGIKVKTQKKKKQKGYELCEICLTIVFVENRNRGSRPLPPPLFVSFCLSPTGKPEVLFAVIPFDHICNSCNAKLSTQKYFTPRIRSGIHT